VLLAEAAIGPDGCAIAGAYLGDGPDLDEVGGRFLGPAAPEGLDPGGEGPLRDLDDFLDHCLWRLGYRSRFGIVAWDPPSLFASLAFEFRKGGAWAVLFTDEVEGRRLVDYHRSPIVFEPLANGRVSVRFGPRKHPDRRDLDASGRQFRGRFVSLQDAVSALSGERVEDLATACMLFDIAPPPSGPATVDSLPERITALRELFRAVRREAESWPGVSFEPLSTATAIVSGAYRIARVPQPLLRDRRTMRVPPRAIGAGIEGASIGARTGLFVRRLDVPGVDVDITSCYPVGAALAGVQEFLTHRARAHRLRGTRSLSVLRRRVESVVSSGLLEYPDVWRSLAFLVKVRPAGDLTAHLEVFGTEATVTAPIVAGSREFWTTGFDMAVAATEDLDRGGSGRVPEIVEAWTFEFGQRIRGLRPVSFPHGWTWDPRRPSTYRSPDGRTWGNLFLLLAAMRAAFKSDPELSRAERIRLRGMLKVASVAGAFGLFSATVPVDDAERGTRHRVTTSDGIVTVDKAPERPGPWAFPPGAALVEGAGRLLLTLLMHEVRIRGGVVVQADTDGCFIAATRNGSLNDQTAAVPLLSFDQIQEIRDAFEPLARWTGLPIVPDRIVDGALLRGAGRPSLLKVEDTVVGPDGEFTEYRCYSPGLRRFAIFPADGDGPWRVSENTIGVMVNPTSLNSRRFARECYRYLLAREAGEPFDGDWLDEPVLWPKRIVRPDELKAARRSIPDLRPTETVVYARSMFGSESQVARWVPGARWSDLDWRTSTGDPVELIPAADGRAVGTVRPWRIFLGAFLRHRVAFTLDEDGRRSDGSTRGRLGPAPILIVGAGRTGRTDWATGTSAEEVIPDPDEWNRIREGLAGIAGSELRRGGLAPRTALAIRAGRRPTRRNADAARRLVAARARAEAGLTRLGVRTCIAPRCREILSGRQRWFCRRHAKYPGSRRKAWREAAGQ
jgi:hypothetical protein